LGTAFLVTAVIGSGIAADRLDELRQPRGDRRPDVLEHLRRHLPEDSDVVITMGCGDTGPILPGKRYEDWTVTDLAGQPIEVVRGVRDDIKLRIDELIGERVSAQSDT
jgi:arsenate reductase